MSREKSSGGLSVTTLIIASLSAAAAALLVPMIWESGTVVAAAITPVIVSLVSETLRHPVERVSSVSTWRRTSSGGVVREEHFEPVVGNEAIEVVEGERPEDPFGLREPQRRSVVRRRPVAIAVATGLLAFAIVAVLVTAGELTLFDKGVSSTGRTTFFGGTPAKATPTATPEPSAAPEGTPAPGATPTPTPEATVTPVGTPPPQPQGTPAPTPSVAPPGPTAAP